MTDGIRRRHSKGCKAVGGGRCTCHAGWEAFVFSVRDGRKIRRTFPTLAAAKAWRADSLTGVHRGTVRAPRPTTIRQAGDSLIAGMKSGLVRTRSGDVYKPSAIRSYEASLRITTAELVAETGVGNSAYVTVSEHDTSWTTSPAVGVYDFERSPAIATPSRSHWRPSNPKCARDGFSSAQRDHLPFLQCNGWPTSPEPCTRGARVEAAGASRPNRPIAAVGAESLNHRLPSEPWKIRKGTLPGFCPLVNLVIVPLVVICPIALTVPWIVNQRLPSAPAAIPREKLPAAKPPNSVITPSVVIRPTAPFAGFWSLNQRFPSGPVTIASGRLPAFSPALNSAIVPLVVLLPIARVVPGSANQRLPSGPTVIPCAELPGFRPALNSVIVPTIVIRPTAGVVPRSVNHMFPSGPATTPSGELPGFNPTLNLVMVPLGVILPIAGVGPASANHRLPSGPVATTRGISPAFRPLLNSVIVPSSVMRPIAGFAPRSANHRFPSGPAVTEPRIAPAFKPALNSVIEPSGAAAAKEAVSAKPTAAVISQRMNVLGTEISFGLIDISPNGGEAG